MVDDRLPLVANPNDDNVTPQSETIDQMISRHQKELQSLDHEKRSAMQTAKSKGKKAKAALKETQFKYEGLERDLKERQAIEIETMTCAGVTTTPEIMQPPQQQPQQQQPQQPQQQQQQQQQTMASPHSEENEEVANRKRQKAIQKKIKKKQQLLQEQIDRENRIAIETSNAGPSPRTLEMEALHHFYLHSRNLEVQEVPADGHCLYRAVALQCARLGLDKKIHWHKQVENGVEILDHKRLRQLCADVLLENREAYEPFAEFDLGHDETSGTAAKGNLIHHPKNFEEYVNNVRNTAEWGGQLELRALSEGLQCPILVFSADGPPVTMGAEFYSSGGQEKLEDSDDWGREKVIFLSYHRHYYALGEHYNSVQEKVHL